MFSLHKSEKNRDIIIAINQVGDNYELAVSIYEKDGDKTIFDPITYSSTEILKEIHTSLRNGYTICPVV